MTRHLNYNPGKDSVEYLEAITCGDNRLSILERLLNSLRAEKGRTNHQHHLIIGPRGSGKTHLLRILTAGRIPNDPLLSETYLPLVMPEETPLRSPGDLLLKFVERLADQLKDTPKGLETEKVRAARNQCLTALTIAKGVKNPLERLPLMAETLESVGVTLERILLPIAENMDQTFYLGAQRSRKGPQDEQWALRRYFQDSPHLLLIGAAPTIFGAVEDPGKAFYDFFRTHNLSELSNDEVLEIIHRRLEYEKNNPCSDVLRHERITALIDHFSENSPKLRGLLVITGGLPRFIHLIYEVIVDTDVNRILDTLNGFLDDLTPYFQTRLDPRIIPQAEIDLLHCLASARGPLQPSEMADELYGVPGNEVSELLNRLHERGLVKRAGRPGGQAVTWDLTEPLFRVWTHFRDNPEGQDLYRLLAKFVALLFSQPDIEKERLILTEKIASLSDEHREKTKFISRYRLIDHAYHELVNANTETTGETYGAVKANGGADINEKNGVDIFRGLNEALDRGNIDLALSHLQQLRELGNAFPDDVKVRELLSLVLVIFINNAENAGNIELCNSLIDELRMLNRSFPEDESVREQLAYGLAIVIGNTAKEGLIEISNSLLDELRHLNKSFHDDEKVRGILAMGLFSAIHFSGHTGNIELSKCLLDELRSLNKSFPNDETIREQLAMGLVNSIHFARKAGNPELSNFFLDELRSLNRSFPDDVNIRGKLAKGTFNSINNMENKENPELSNSLLDELRSLNRSFPDDETVREQLASGIVNSIVNAGNAKNFEFSNSLMDELRILNRSFSDDEKVRERLAMGLYNSIHFAGNAGESELFNSFLNELRILNGSAPNDKKVREILAMRLVKSINAKNAENVKLNNSLLDELRMLNRSFPDDEKVREYLAKGLFNSIIDVGNAKNLELRHSLIDELIKLSAPKNHEAIEEIINKTAMLYSKDMISRMKAGDSEAAIKGMKWLETRMPGHLADLIRPFSLAMDVLEKGEEKALAREPEEVKRVVRLVLDETDKK